MLPDGSVVTKVEPLSSTDEERLGIETGFTRITRNLINERLRAKAAKLIPGSEEVGPDLSVISLTMQFEQVIKTLQENGFTEEEAESLVMGQGRQFTGLETHMGEMPGVVKEEVVDLITKINTFYDKKFRKTK